MCSIAASMATMAFNKYFSENVMEYDAEWKCSLTPQSVEIQKKHYDYMEVLNKAIAKGGTTIHSYTSVDGVIGTYQDSLFVHNKEKEHCPICQNQIKKIKVGGRGTYYCPHCQK